MSRDESYAGLKAVAYDYIFERLIDNSFKPGDRIREDLIAQDMDISRTPVREAINQLVAKDLIVNVPRKGLFVTEISDEEAAGIIDVRVALETLAAERCCQFVTDEEIVEMEGLYDTYEAFMRAGNFVEAGVTENKLHKLIASKSNNPKLYRYISELLDLTMATKGQKVQNWPPAMIETIINDHKNTLNAIKARDAKKARQYMEQDIRRLLVMIQQGKP